MPDALGWRAKIGVLVPSTNTIVQPDLEVLRPAGVTNHVSRITVPNMSIASDDDFAALMALVDDQLYAAADRVMTAAPDILLVGMSSVLVWGGYEASEARRRALQDHAGVPVTGGSFALDAALRLYGAKRLALFSPYQPIADAQVTRFLNDRGFEVVRFLGLKCPTPLAIAEIGEDEVRRHILEVDGDDVDAVVQVGTNLSCMRLCAEAERWLGKPVIAINPLSYWHALRTLGIEDRIDGFGGLLAAH
jgi:maleate isomerase